jgi:hypothetical protein
LTQIKCYRGWELDEGFGDTLTQVRGYPGYEASDPGVSDDGRFFVFQMGMSRNAAGVGHGLFIYDIEKAEKDRH